MKNPLIYLVFICICFTTNSFSANARTDGAGKLSSLSDISNVVGHPASINDFPDQFMGTVGAYTDSNDASQDYTGAFILKKSLGSIFNIGFIGNTLDPCGSSVLNSQFYHDAREFLLDTSNTSDETLPELFPMIPHLILGLDLDVFRFGIEFFLETARFKQTINGDVKETINKSIRNIGTRMSTTMVFNETWLCLFVGFSLPQINGESNIDSTINTYSSKDKRYLGLGTELGTGFGKTSLVGGLYYTNESYTFKKNDMESSAFTTNMYYIYLSTKTKILKDMTIGAGYNLTLWFEDIILPERDTVGVNDFDYSGLYTYHNFHMGVEKPFRGKKVFDEIAFRSGIIYSFKKVTEKYNFLYDEFDMEINNPINTNDLKLNAGLGVQKHVFCLDLFVNIGNWDGVFTGPKGVSATVTVGLSKEFLVEDRL